MAKFDFMKMINDKKAAAGKGKDKPKDAKGKPAVAKKKPTKGKK